MARKREPKTYIEDGLGKFPNVKPKVDNRPMSEQCKGTKTKKHCKRGGMTFEVSARMERSRTKIVDSFSNSDKKEYQHYLEVMQRARKNMTEWELQLLKMRERKVS